MRAIVFGTIVAAMLPTLAVGNPSLKKMIEASRMPGGWEVRCHNDQHRGQNNCFAVKFVSNVPFKVTYKNGVGPAVEPGLHSMMALLPSVRVDNGPVRNATGKDAAIVEDLKVGSTAYAIFYSPRGEHRMTVPLDGFPAAEKRLREIVAGGGQ
jgi:invasion protein IalB